MKNVIVVYESSYGNTHTIAEAIADGLRLAHAVEVMSVAHVDPTLAAQADLLVVGGPTHVHGMSSARTRSAAVDAVPRSNGNLLLDADATAPGLREWFQTLKATGTRAAAFDTRVDTPAFISGRASKEISRQLRSAGFRLIDAPHSFLVTKATHLVPGQVEAARLWGETLSKALETNPSDIRLSHEHESRQG